MERFGPGLTRFNRPKVRSLYNREAATNMRPYAKIAFSVIALLLLAVVLGNHAPWPQVCVGLAVLSVWTHVLVRGRALFGRRWRTIKRLVIAVLVATVVHAVACIIKRPFEFGDGSRFNTFIFAFVSGLVAFPVVLPVVLLPLAAGVRHFIPHAGERTHALVAAAVLLASVAELHIVPFFRQWEPPPHCHGFLTHWAFWSFFSVAVAISFFWPLAAPDAMGTDAAHDAKAAQIATTPPPALRAGAT